MGSAAGKGSVPMQKAQATASSAGDRSYSERLTRREPVLLEADS